MSSRHPARAAWSWTTTALFFCASTSFLSHVKRGTCTQHTFAVSAYGRA